MKYLKKRIILQLFAVFFLFSGLIAGSYLVKQSQDIRKKAATVSTTSSDWRKILNNWPVNNPDTISIWNTTGGKLNQLIIKNNTWWFRDDPSSLRWSTGKIFQEENKTGVELPSSLDSGAVFYLNGELWQTVTKDIRYYTQRVGQAWTHSGYILQNETSSCGVDLPRNGIDSMTVFPWGDGLGITITKGNFFWFKEDLNSIVYSRCGKAVNDPSAPPKFDGHEAFLYDGKLAEVFTSGSDYWFFPDVTNRQIFYEGQINSVDINVNPDMNLGKISPYIFGANLVWHEPHNRFYISERRDQIASLIKDLGITIIRYPGGCGGDAYNWKNIYDPNTSVQGTTIDEMIDILSKSEAKLYYTLNVEGTTHVNQNNCHNLMDHPGNLQEAQELLLYFKENNVPLQRVEIGNEPWAGNSDYPNWRESWTAIEYASVMHQVTQSLSAIWPSVSFTAATGGKVDWEKEINLSDISAFQYHPYFFGTSENDDPLTQANRTHQILDAAEQRHSKQLDISEYGLYCWTGVPRSDGYEHPINPYAYKAAHGIYLAEMLKEFIDHNVQYAMFWELFEAKESPWKCGLIREDSSGNYIVTPAGVTLKLLSKNLRTNRINVVQNFSNLITLASKDEKNLTTLIINPSAVSYAIQYVPGTTSSQPIVIERLEAESLSSSSFTTSISTVSSMTDQSYSLTINPYSINIINYSLSTSITPTPSFTPTPKPGDSDGDGDVDEEDYGKWLLYYDPTKIQDGGSSIGDFNNDSKVDGIDYTIWLNHYGT